MRTLTCKHKIWGKNWLYLRPYLKAFSVSLFSMFLKLAGYIYWQLISELSNFLKKFIERLFEISEICSHGANYVQNL